MPIHMNETTLARAISDKRLECVNASEGQDYLELRDELYTLRMQLNALKGAN